jgi:hypothetical protein
VVERFNRFANRRQDLLGCIDILALYPGVGIVGVQVTSGANHAARRTKSLAEPRLRTWLESGGRFEVWSYSKRGGRSHAKRWTLRREEITLDHLPAEPPPEELLPAGAGGARP